MKREVIVLTCILEGKSSRPCSKRPCRNPERDELGNEMLKTGKFGSIVRHEMASKLMLFGERIPPHLYSDRTLRDAKSEALQKKHVDKDVNKALCILKESTMANSIHYIGMNPFYVYYSTVQQLHFYQSYCKENAGTIVIDATGSIVKKITRPDGSLSGNLHTLLLSSMYLM